MAPFKLFNLRRGRVLTNLIRTGQGDHMVALCDYSYTTGSGKSRTTHVQTICVIQAAHLNLGHFFVRHQVAVFDFLGKVFGGQDINFEEDPTFSKAYVLQSIDHEHDLRRRFDASTRETFVQLADKKIQAEGLGDRLLLHYGRRLNTDRFRELVDDAMSVRRVFRQ